MTVATTARVLFLCLVPLDVASMETADTCRWQSARGIGNDEEKGLGTFGMNEFKSSESGG